MAQQTDTRDTNQLQQAQPEPHPMTFWTQRWDPNVRASRVSLGGSTTRESGQNVDEVLRDSRVNVQTQDLATIHAFPVPLTLSNPQLSSEVYDSKGHRLFQLISGFRATLALRLGSFKNKIINKTSSPRDRDNPSRRMNFCGSPHDLS